MAYEEGQRVRAEFTGTVQAYGTGKNATSRVKEDISGIVHYLFLADKDILAPGTPAPARGDTISVAFDAEVRGEEGSDPFSTTEVRSAGNVTHYLYLDSESVSLIPEEREEVTYEAGQEVRVEFRGTVLSEGEEKANTSKVREDGTGIVHFLYLGTYLPREALLASPAPGNPALTAGDVIEVAFNATVSDLQMDVPAGTIRIRDVKSGYTHFVNTGSPSVTAVTSPGKYESAGSISDGKVTAVILPEVTGEKEKEEKVPYTGREIRVEFDATVIEGGGGPISTSKVVEDGTGITHYLFLYSKTSRNAILKDDDRDGNGRPEAGSRVRVAFTARVPDKTIAEADGTTRIKGPADSATAIQYTHCLNLGSPSITAVIPPEKPEEKKEEKMPYKPGQEIRVEFDATVTEGKGGPISTSKVVEDETGITHYLYLYGKDSRTMLLKDDDRDGNAYPETGSKVRVAFTTEIRNSAPQARPDGTTEIPGPRRTDGTLSRYTHYLNLDSPSITAVPAGAEKAITSTDEVIESGAVTARIEKLRKSKPLYRLTRNRAYTVTVEVFASRADADVYLDERDLNPERFTLDEVRGELSTAQATELAELESLNLRGESFFGVTRWEAGVTLRPLSYYSASWARELAMSRLGIESYQLDEWPLSLVSWRVAADEELRARYRGIAFGDKRYFGLSA